MAVYKQTYVPYEGAMRSDSWRFAVLTRYAFLSIVESRLLVLFFALCFIPPLLACGIVYANHNAKAMEGLMVGDIVKDLPIGSGFYTLVFRTQAFLSFLLVTFVGPGLVSADTANSALVIYLSKPLSRMEYVVGRLTVLLALMSAVTWIPATVLIGVQTDLAGLRWLFGNYRVGLAFLLSFWLWIVVTSLLALAISACVKWRPLATGALLIVFFAGAGFGLLTNQMLQIRMQWGLLLSLDSSISMVFDWLMEGMAERGNVPAWSALAWLITLCVACAMLLRKRIHG
jgi:ABC-2 type transport system permease protein